MRLCVRAAATLPQYMSTSSVEVHAMPELQGLGLESKWIGSLLSLGSGIGCIELSPIGGFEILGESDAMFLQALSKT